MTETTLNMKDDKIKTDNLLNSSGNDNDEDLRVIADMSGLEPRNNLLGRRGPKEGMNPDKKAAADIDSEGRIAAIKGALAATFAIYFAYAAVFGIFIYLLTRLL